MEGLGALAPVVVARASDGYGSVGWRLGTFLALAAFLGLAAFRPDASLVVFLAAQAAGLAAGHLLARWDPIRHHLISDSLVGIRIRARALRAFAESGLTRTAGRTGILVFVSLLERRVMVLADEGVNRVLGPEESWEEVVELAVDGFRQGRAAEGLLRAVARCGEILSAHLPASARRVDVFPTTLVLED